MIFKYFNHISIFLATLLEVKYRNLIRFKLFLFVHLWQLKPSNTKLFLKNWTFNFTLVICFQLLKKLPTTYKNILPVILQWG